MATALHFMPEGYPSQIRRKVRIGGMTKAELLEQLAKAGVQVNLLGQQLFADDRFRTLDLPSIVEAVQTTVGALGLPHGGVFAHIIEAAAKRGLALCPLELGPHLRLALLDQDEGAQGFARTPHQAPPGSITIASPPIAEGEDTPNGFYLRRITGTLWLRGYRSWPGHVWQPQDVLIFSHPRNAA